MVYGIVKQSGGFVFVDSQKGEWTEFRLFFPEVGSAPGSAEDEAAGEGVLKPNEAVLIPGNETILVVEDEDMVRKLTCSILQRAGYTVLSASGALEAIGVLKNHPSEIELLLTDVIMPGMTGDVLVEQARPIRPEMAMLFMSGHSGKALDGVANSGLELLEKPFTADQLARRVRSVLDGEASTAAA
jgi:CheY-like chemotaxis protein